MKRISKYTIKYLMHFEYLFHIRTNVIEIYCITLTHFQYYFNALTTSYDGGL